MASAEPDEVAVKLEMKCRHVIDVDPDKTPEPRCWCGERIVARSLGNRRPRIVGHARGPLVDSRYLGATAVSVAPKGPLPLKPETQVRDAGTT